MERKFARRCRELMLAAGSADAREQLRLWAEELDQQAAALERRAAKSQGSEASEGVSGRSIAAWLRYFPALEGPSNIGINLSVAPPRPGRGVIA
jgi:hypothetical protein